MNFLPKELEDIIVDYKIQMEHKEKYSKCMKEINNIEYDIYELPEEDIQAEINEHMMFWNNAGLLNEPVIYPVPLHYFYKEKSERIMNSQKIEYHYYYDQLLCSKGRKIFLIEEREDFSGEDVSYYRD